MNINFKDKKTIALMITAGTLILLTAAIVAIVFLFPAKKIEIPDFSNKSKVDVDAWILENDLTVEDVTFTYEYNETTEKDMVLSQSILAGEKLKKDEVLNIILSNGYDPTLVVTIPDFKDMKYEEIHQWFTDNKFTDVTYEYIPDQKVKKDYFIKSNLTASEAHRNDMILISISVGTESVGVEITMPDFADYTKANIQAWGKTNNMSITFKTEASDKIAKDKVISQTPKAGETTKTGGKVTVTISTGKGTTAVKFDGKTKKDVDAWAKENGIKISYEEEYDNDVANGIIMSNTPNSGIIKTGSTMKVKYSIGKPVVENYTNKSKDSFIAHKDALNKKGADIKVTINEVQSDKNPGTILKQIINTKTVTTSTTVNTGTTVTIEVAKAKP
ncbi:PASTA domain-containing protein, partial [Anaerorhabdus sp.]|uniref:PASTA domain-containing protein n=1 Tax=Anaerorhabdus sp. TaxID=1872524 RepID=UPI002FCB2601